MALQLFLGFVLAAIVAYAAWRFHALDTGGAVAAVLAGGFIFGFGGLGASAALIVFFLTGSVLSSLPHFPRPRADRPLLRKEEIAGGYARNWKQVAANGGVPLAAILASHFVSGHAQFFLLAYYGAIAAMCADSWGTEMGTRYGRDVFEILSGAELSRGESGGISERGMAASVAGAAVIALTALVAGAENVMTCAAILLAGTCGAISDSILGSSVQGKFWVAGNDSICEDPQDASSGTRPARLLSGYWSIRNNSVNFAASAIGALIILILLGPR